MVRRPARQAASTGHPRCAAALLSCVALVAVMPGLPATARAEPPPPLQFNQDIRPILADNCFACHGPDRNKRQAGLRLDLAEAATAPLRANRRAIVPGDRSTSQLAQRITAADPDLRMPPAESNKSLTPEQVDTLLRWIDQGAEYHPHWAYIRPQRPATPPTHDATWPRNAIDGFVLAGLEARGRKPAPEADRVTLIRRLSFDLTGLAPSPAGVRAFVEDTRPDAYELLVARLLASPHYGERMAMHWLDLVRYADTNGYHGDNYRNVWLYRDYVIAAFNDNMPFDRFTTEQLAGDLLPDPTIAQRIASGYNRMNMITAEGGAQPKEYLLKYAADRVRNASSVWMGATLGCAECHDHKFDPYTARDFYSFAAFFADLQEEGVYNHRPGRWDPEMMVPSAAQAAELKRLDDERAALRQQLDTSTPELAAGQARWEAQTRAQLLAGDGDWIVVKPDRVKSAGGAMLKVLDDLSVLSTGENPVHDRYEFTATVDQADITGVRLEVLRDPSLTNGALARGNGNFVLTGFALERTAANKKLEPVKIASATADYSQEHWPVAAAIDGKPESGWAVEGHINPADHQAVFTLAEPLPGGPQTKLVIRLKHESAHAHHNIGRFRISLTSLPKPELSSVALPQSIRTILDVEPDQRQEAQHAELAAYYRSIAPELEPARRRLLAATAEKTALEESIPRTMIAVSVEPRVTRILPRGNWLDESGEVVEPAVPSFLPPLGVENRRATRLDLARWIMAPENPLTARVFVNRLWKLFFGTGISKTLDDLGSQGEWPKHPELLDWLAVELRESGWDIKHLVRLMVTSATYRQSSRDDPKLREQDPYNRWLARQSRFRLEAEMVRDNALAASGLLSLATGGPSVKPYQPEGYWDQLNFPPRTYEQDAGEALYRRGLYTYWMRTFLHPSLLAFDATTREECTVERPRSNTPLQALTLLNDPSYVEAARVLAERSIRQGGPAVDERLDWMYRLVLSRPPESAEREVLAKVYSGHLSRYAADVDAARELIGAGEWPVPQDIEAPELAAWTSVARVILNLHETITRY